MYRPIILMLLFVMPMTFNSVSGQTDTGKDPIKLLVRGDDIGSFHAANLGCIKSYQEGIMRSVEIMVPCAWYPEAVELLNSNPGLDVGIHLVMTSEWSAMKWRPLTGISSITDERGFFFPMVWPNDNFGPDEAFRNSDWKLEDVEKELRAQIELAKREITNVSHISSHMGFTSAHESIDSLVTALAKEYDLHISTADHGVQRFHFKPENRGDYESRVSAFLEGLNSLTPGTYMFVEHPALDVPEMSRVGHTGYMNVGRDRQMVTDMFTDKRIIEKINNLGIELISYQEL